MNEHSKHPVARTQRGSDTPPPRPLPIGRDTELEQAIAADAIAIRYQPQIEPTTGRVIGVEALARWPGEDGPTELFARAAQHGLQERLSRTVQRRALREAGKWRGLLGELDLSINLIAEDIARDGYIDWLLAEVSMAGLRPSRLTVEITESSLIIDPAAAARRLDQLRDAGVKIAVDDFGCGYSSLAYLSALPLDALKIDRAMIADIVGGSRDRIVVRAMIRLARELGLKVVVEGVESTEQLALLAAWGCDLYQGFLGAGALDQKELARFVSATIARAA